MSRSSFSKNPPLIVIEKSSIYSTVNPKFLSSSYRTVRSHSSALRVPFALAFFLGLLLVSNSLASSVDEMRDLGRMSTAISLVLPALFYIPVALGRRVSLFSVPLSLIGFAVLAALLVPRLSAHERGYESFIPLLQIALVSLFFYSTSGFQWTNTALRTLAVPSGLWGIAVLTMWYSSSRELPYSAYADNPNPFGGLAASFMVVSLLGCVSGRDIRYRTIRLVLFAVGTTLVGLSLSRSAALSLFCGMFVWWCWHWISASRIRHRLVFLLTVAGSLFFVFSQTLMIDLLRDAGYQELSIQLTGKNLGTREYVWSTIVAAIMEQPVWGHGPSVSTVDILNAELSSHCLYLQVTLQCGCIGCVALLYILWSIWENIWIGRRDPIVQLAASAMIGMLVHQTFEVTLTQNHLAIGSLAWLAMGIAVSRCNQIANQQRTQSKKRRVGSYS